MRFSDYLAHEWRPALGCTEPASIAYATGLAAAVAGGAPQAVAVACDPRLYKNCYAVGIPNSGRRSGMLWTAALGALVARPEARLEVFRHVRPELLPVAAALLEAGAVTARVDASHTELWAECRVRGERGEARVVLRDDHTNIVAIELNGEPQPLDAGLGRGASAAGRVRAELAALPIAELVGLAATLDDRDRAELRRGTDMNLAMAEHGLGLLPRQGGARSPVGLGGARASLLVSGGVYGRMSGEDLTVMTLAGSGNKGITCSVPIACRAKELGVEPRRADEALALACMLTSVTTHHLGTLSAICGSANAAGIGLAAGLVALEGGTPRQVSLAVTNMVGNVSGMICDGAKIGCAMKCMTGVDAAFRAAFFALQDIGIPVTDGIVGADGEASLQNLARIARRGMDAVETEILAIMQEKLDAARADGGDFAK
ncbi:MAG: serine dehydratase subunit alpha family protein [Planctomycetes bacterium]|nr:serine dehydratase subunit alpha family protein [Planctomycetota bacterium]